MKQLPTTIAATVLAATLSAPAWAQSASSVQVYGQMTGGLTDRDHQTGGGHLREAGPSQFAASLIGLRGGEDLGGGLGAVFRLESGIGPDVGTAGGTVAGTNKFWNRQSFVGLNFGSAATLTLGRQFHAATERVVQSLDVYNVGGTSLAVTPLALFAVNKFVGNDSRADDSIKLRVFGPVGLTAGFSASLNETTAGRGLAAYSFEAGQVTKAYTVSAYLVDFEAPAVAANGTRPRHKAVGFGGNLPIGSLTAYLHWLDSKLDPSAVGRVEQKNRILHLGLNWMLTPEVSLKFAAYHDKGTAMNGVAGRDGTKDTLIASAEYAFSKRTSVHAGVISNRLADGYTLDPTNIAALGRDPNASSTRWLTAGIRHNF